MIARVRGPMRAATWSRSMLRVTRSQSTNTGFAPTFTIMFSTVKKLSAQVMTSSPGPIRAICSATSMAAVADVSTRTGRPSQCAESAASKRSTHGPLVTCPERSTSVTPSIVASSINGPANFIIPLSGGARACRSRAPRDQPHAEDDEADAEPALHRDRFAEQILRGQCVHDVAEGKHRVSDGNGHAREARDPHHDADRVQRDARDHVTFHRDAR